MNTFAHENEQLRAALKRIIERCEVFIDDEADMRTHSVEVLMGIAEDALTQQAGRDGDGTFNFDNSGQRCVCREEFGYRVCADMAEASQQVTWAIEACGASPELTHAVTLSSALTSKLRATRPAQTEQPVAAVIGFYEDEREPRLLSWNPLPNGEHRLYDAPFAQTASQPEQSGWNSVEDRLPESGRHVLAYYTNSLAKGRRIRAEYVAPKSREVDADYADPDTQCVKYDEESDSFYLIAGWYELIDNWDEYTSIAVVEGEVTHWTPLPAAPALPNQGGEE